MVLVLCNTGFVDRMEIGKIVAKIQWMTLPGFRTSRYILRMQEKAEEWRDIPGGWMLDSQSAPTEKQSKRPVL